MKEHYRRVLVWFVPLIVGIGGVTIDCSFAVTSLSAAEVSSSVANTTILTTLTYSNPKKGEQRLTLIKNGIRHLSVAERMEFDKSHPKGFSVIPNLVFQLVGSGMGTDQNSNVLCCVYEHYSPIPKPDVFWHSALAWDSRSEMCYVVLTKDVFPRLDIRVYAASPINVVAVFPLELNPRDYDRWPVPSQPLARYKGAVSIESKSYGGLTGVTAKMEHNQLVIVANYGENSAPILFRYEFKANKWRVDAPKGIELHTIDDK